MEPFEQRGALNDKLGKHPSTNIPAGLTWDYMGPNIQAALQGKRRRRRLLWWIPAGLVTAALLLWWSSSEQVDLGHFPLPRLGAHAVAVAPTSTDPQTAHASSERAAAGSDAHTPAAVVVARPDQSPAVTETGRNSAATRPAPSLNTAALPTARPEAVTSQREEVLSATLRFSATTEALEPLATLMGRVSAPPTALPAPVAPVTDPTETAELWQLEVGMGSNKYCLNPRDSIGAPRSLLGLEASLIGARRIKESPYFFRTGLIFSQLTRRERQEVTVWLNLYQPNTPDTIYRNLFTGTEEIVYTDSIRVARRLSIQQHQYLRTYTLPLMIGRQWENERWPWGLQAGIDLNWSRWRKGHTLNRDYERVPINTEGKLSTALRLEGQLYSPTIGPGRLFLRLSYQRFLSNVPNPNGAFPYRPQVFALQLGGQVVW